MCIKTSPFKVNHSYNWASSQKVRCLFFQCIVRGPNIFFFYTPPKKTQKIKNTLKTFTKKLIKIHIVEDLRTCLQTITSMTQWEE